MKKILAITLLGIALCASAGTFAVGEDVITPGHKRPAVVLHGTWLDHIKSLWIEFVTGF